MVRFGLDSKSEARFLCSQAEAAELPEIQRFRYQIYVEEMHKPLGIADHERRLLIDPLDEGAFHYSCRRPNGDLVGSFRLHMGASFPAAVARRLGLEPFFHRQPLPPAYMSKAMFSRNVRGRGAMVALFSHAYRVARRAGCVIGFSHCNPKLVPLYQRLGLEIFGKPFTDPEVGTQVPMLLVLEDFERLQAIRSPLAADCVQFENNRARPAALRHELLNHAEPELTEALP